MIAFRALLRHRELWRKTELKILCIGFGHVGRTLARILTGERSQSPLLSSFDLAVVGLTTASRGSLENRGAVDLARAINEIGNSGCFSPDNPDFSRLESLEAARELDYDVLVELSPLNLKDKGEPAVSYLTTALERGKHCVTANKGPIAFSYPELHALAQKNSVHLKFESTVMDGAPIFNMARSALRGCRVLAIEGILNSTSNFVLSQVEQGLSVADAILDAQEGGFAEADPSHDLEGWDAAAKICILARVLMDADVSPLEVRRQGFADLDPEEIRRAVSAGTRIRMVAEAKRSSGQFRAEVGLRTLAEQHPFSGVKGTGNIVRIETDLMCPITIRQDSPTVWDSAYGVLNDLMEIGAG